MSHFNLTIDEITFKAVCKQKTAAQKKLYELFSTPIYNLAYRITQNQSDAMDISHEVFIKVFTKIKQLKDKDLLGFWIRKITLNTTFSMIKKHEKLITNINFKEKCVNTDFNETMSSLEYALQKIPVVPRTILWLYEVEGMTHEEIAKIYGKTISFSKTHLYRAKNLAQTILTTQGGGYEVVRK